MGLAAYPKMLTMNFRNPEFVSSGSIRVSKAAILTREHAPGHPLIQSLWRGRLTPGLGATTKRSRRRDAGHDVVTSRCDLTGRPERLPDRLRHSLRVSEYRIVDDQPLHHSLLPLPGGRHRRGPGRPDVHFT